MSGREQFFYFADDTVADFFLVAVEQSDFEEAEGFGVANFVIRVKSAEFDDFLCGGNDAFFEMVHCIEIHEVPVCCVNRCFSAGDGIFKNCQHRLGQLPGVFDRWKKARGGLFIGALFRILAFLGHCFRGNVCILYPGTASEKVVYADDRAAVAAGEFVEKTFGAGDGLHHHEVHAELARAAVGEGIVSDHGAFSRVDLEVVVGGALETRGFGFGSGVFDHRDAELFKNDPFAGVVGKHADVHLGADFAQFFYDRFGKIFAVMGDECAVHVQDQSHDVATDGVNIQVFDFFQSGMDPGQPGIERQAQREADFFNVQSFAVFVGDMKNAVLSGGRINDFSRYRRGFGVLPSIAVFLWEFDAHN